MTDTTLIQNSLDTQGIFDGSGLSYEVDADIVLPDAGRLRNCTLIQTNPGAARRTVKKVGGEAPRLENVAIVRGFDTTAGTIADSAGVWLANCGGRAVLDGVEVTGHGPGSGLMLYGLDAPVLRRLYVHDMRWSAGSDPGTEQVAGIWLQQCKNFTLETPTVKRLDSLIGATQREWQTDGISVSGCRDFTILAPQVAFAGECIDLSGTDGNKGFSIIGGSLTDADSFGLKMANSASDWSVSGVIATRCGFSGFVVSGPSAAGLPRIERGTLIGCEALDTGSNGRWSAYNIVGFGIMSSAYEPTLPEKIRMVECRAIDRQAVRTMKYGFRNENNNTANKLLNCASEGHTIAATLGTFG